MIVSSRATRHPPRSRGPSRGDGAGPGGWFCRLWRQPGVMASYYGVGARAHGPAFSLLRMAFLCAPQPSDQLVPTFYPGAACLPDAVKCDEIGWPRQSPKTRGPVLQNPAPARDYVLASDSASVAAEVPSTPTGSRPTDKGWRCHRRRGRTGRSQRRPSGEARSVGLRRLSEWGPPEA